LQLQLFLLLHLLLPQPALWLHRLALLLGQLSLKLELEQQQLDLRPHLDLPLHPKLMHQLEL
jgi:hypothetical protein